MTGAGPVVDEIVAEPAATRPPVGRALASGAACTLPKPKAANAAQAITALVGRLLLMDMEIYALINLRKKYLHLTNSGRAYCYHLGHYQLM